MVPTITPPIMFIHPITFIHQHIILAIVPIIDHIHDMAMLTDIIIMAHTIMLDLVIAIKIITILIGNTVHTHESGIR
jgi:hypothetical protein